MKKPLIKSIKKGEGSVELLLSFPEDAEYFDGHFPNVPILPGVAQVHLAMGFAEEHFGIVPELIEMKAIKFSRVITPNTDIKLVLSQEAQKNKITYAYSHGGKACSSGIFILNN